MTPTLTTFDVSQYLKICEKTVRDLVHRGDLAAHRVGRDYRFTAEDIAIYLHKVQVNGR